MARGLEGFHDDVEVSAAYVAQRGVPVYASALRAAVSLFASDERLRARVLDAWGAREFHASYERPMLLLAALRFEALGDRGHPLSREIAEERGDGIVDREALAAAMTDAVLETMRSRAVQTNEVSRSIAWRLALGELPRGELALVDLPRDELALVDLGCSAALNLVGDEVDQAWTSPDGAPIPLVPTTHVTARFGLDRRPIDARDEREARWLRACIWPGQTDRSARLDEALSLAARALDAGEISLHAVDAEEMPSWLERLDRRALAMQTVFVEYLPPDVRARYEAGMRRWLAARPDCAWVELETGPGAHGPAVIRLHRATGATVLASCEYHPRVVHLERARG
ncbi:MAG: DUF2332 family protein [Deltaproteobacteria bacterium]|nr:DUF2332 family protein [Deltaproteobacteria bacterium]